MCNSARNWEAAFQSHYRVFCSHQQWMGAPSPPRPHWHVVWSVLHSNHSGRCTGCPTAVSVCISLVTSAIQHLSCAGHLLTFSGEVSAQAICPFFKLACFLIIECREFLMYPGYKSFLIVWQNSLVRPCGLKFSLTSFLTSLNSLLDVGLVRSSISSWMCLPWKLYILSKL